jgi:hypothetical protein
MKDKVVMVEKLNLRKIKIKTQRTILEDGLLELMLGIYFVLSGIYLANKSLILNYLWLPFALVLIDVIRRRYVYPRTGYVKLKLSTNEIIRMLLAIVIGVGLITGITALIATGIGRPLAGNWRNSLTFALILFTIIFFCGIAYRYSTPRWYFHGILIGFVILINQVIKIPALVIGLGVLMIATGLWVFTGYLRKHPVQSDEVHGNAGVHQKGE